MGTPSPGNQAGPLMLTLTEAAALFCRWVATLILNLLLFLVFSAVVATLVFLIMPDGRGLKPLAATAAATLCVIAALALSPQRATAAAISLALRRYRLASKVLDLLFVRMCAEDGQLATTTRRIPLKEAQSRLHAAVDALALDRFAFGPIGRFVVTRVRRKLVAQVEKYTLSELRRDSVDGSVDMQLVQQRLSSQLDDRIGQWFVSRAHKAMLGAMLAIAILSLGISATCRLVLQT